jgi:GNAT superfamily N-acetyltransferase
MILRAATPDDIPLILDFIRALAVYEKLPHEVEATEGLLGVSFFPQNGRPAAECVLAFDDDVPAGFAVYFTSFSTFLARPGLYLEDLFVVPERRGRGVGKALFLHLAKLANERACGRMEWRVLNWNESAIKFYEGLGARRLDDWTTCRLAGGALHKLA